MANETYTQVAPNSSGNKIRNFSAEVLQPDGTIATVQMQVVSLVDAEGRSLDLVDNEWKQGMLDKLDQIVEQLMLITSVSGKHSP